MSDLGDLLFRHFEKILGFLFGLVLLYSVFFYGPWTYSTDFDGRLADLAAALSERPDITAEDVPQVPDYEAKYLNVGIAESQGKFEDPYFWDTLPELTGPPILPPADVAAIANRGLVEIDWDHNPNQTNVEGVAEFLGVEVARATVVGDEVGDYEVLTRSGDRDYLTPQELFDNNRQHAPQAAESRRGRARQEAARTGITLADLWSAVVDGRLTPSRVAAVVRDGIPRGEFTSEDLYEVRAFIRQLPWVIADRRREIRRTEQRNISQDEALRLVLAEMGIRGGGKYGLVQGEAASAAPDAAGQPKERTVRWGEVISFFDSAVSPDLRYSYRTRFWAMKTAELPHDEIQTDWAEAPGAISPKPDTEFSLTGGYVDVGMPWISVRKWLPAANRWESRNYRVAPGEQIGRMEVLPETDAKGQVARDDQGNVKMQTVDFSTQCVLLAFREVPRPSGQSVDMRNSRMYPMLQQLQIVYADRRGDLRVKWQAPAGAY